MYTTHDFRRCSRCNLPLTDQKSFEIGVGPICLKKDKLLYSKTLQVQIAHLGKYLCDLDLDNLPIEIKSEVLSVKNSIFSKLQIAVANQTNENVLSCSTQTPPTLFIKEVKRIDYFLSWQLSHQNKQAFINIVYAIGFPALANVFAGKASTGEADIKFVDGNFLILGSRVKTAYIEFIKLRDIQVPKRYGAKEYIIPAKYVDKILNWVYEYWPIIDNLYCKSSFL